MLNLKKYFKIYSRKKNQQDNSAKIVKQRLDDVLKLVVTYPIQGNDGNKIDGEQFQKALINFICDYLKIEPEEVNFKVYKQGKQSICNMTVAINDETVA